MLGLFLLGCWVLAARQTPQFARDIEPILSKHCYGCHGPKQQMNGLRLDRRQDALRGGYSGPAIQPGDGGASRLILLVSGTRGSANPKGLVMPPAGGRLSGDEIATLRTWIDRGAEWPDTERSARVAASGHWAFQPPRRPSVPAVRNRDRVCNPIDAFVLARLEAEGIPPSPEAARSTLIRRLSLDLTGLPPTPAEVAAFVNDSTPEAYERVVDRLLDSPHYGEKWARHWLDQARYADSDGYQKDLVRPHAWRYRQWVIEALNRDLPFDRFTIEQIAGDLLPNSTIEQKVATGFHRNTLTNREGGTDPAEFRFAQVADRTNTTDVVWLGVTMGCAQCHDHKYDPITQKDYYRLFAFFNNAEEANIDAPLPGEMGPYLQSRPGYIRQRRALLEAYNVPELQAEWEQRILDAADKPTYLPGYDAAYRRLRVYLDHGDKILRKPAARRSEGEQQRLTRFFLADYSVVITKERYEEIRFKDLEKKLRALESSFPALSQAQTMTESADTGPTHIHIRGEWNRRGIEVQPGTPEFLPPLPAGSQPSRLTLARWLVSPENPLTARVAVNRMWQELFGRGIVVTSEDFGAQGAKPTHPELLDWLAMEFMDCGWSMKQMHKLMVMSATYRQSSNSRPELSARDPYNALLARQARLRLPAELIRDSALAVSGLLAPAIGGKSVVLSRPAERDDTSYADEADAVRKGSREQYRRGLYVHFQRKTPEVMLMNFDAPNAFASVCRRERSNTPLQALNLLNDPVLVEGAQALAARVLREAPGTFPERIGHAFQLCLARKPDPRESERLLAYYTQEKSLLRDDPKAAQSAFPFEFPEIDPLEGAAWVGVSRVLLNLDQFITRE